LVMRLARMGPPRRPAACNGDDGAAAPTCCLQRKRPPCAARFARFAAPGEDGCAWRAARCSGDAPGRRSRAAWRNCAGGGGWSREGKVSCRMDGWVHMAGWRLGRLVSLELTLGPDINGLDEELQRQVLLPNCREISFHPTGGPTATREDRRRRTGGGLSDTSYGTDRARRCRFQVCSLAFQPFLRAQTVPYFLTQTAVYLTALGSQNFSPTWSATSFVIGPVVTGESGFVMNPGCLISWFGPNPAGENGDD
jgi:hypothetical protein